MLVQFDNVTKAYDGKDGRVCALDGVSLTLDAGRFIAVRGPSGCGKSTLLLTAGGLLRPTAGSVRIDGKTVYDLSAEQRAAFRASTIGFVFQQFHLVPYLTVFDNVLSASLALPGRDAPGRAEELLERFNLTHRRNHTPGELSTGEKQRTALARALLNQPKLLLADEPTGNLDPDNAAIVLESLQQFASDGGGVLLVTHDQNAADAADDTVNMRDGRLESSPAPTGGTP